MSNKPKKPPEMIQLTKDELRRLLMEAGAKNPYEAVPLPPSRSRQRKLVCPSCGYIVRTSAQWIRAGLPTCHCGTKMQVAGGADAQPVDMSWALQKHPLKKPPMSTSTPVAPPIVTQPAAEPTPQMSEAERNAKALTRLIAKQRIIQQTDPEGRTALAQQVNQQIDNLLEKADV